MFYVAQTLVFTHSRFVFIVFFEFISLIAGAADTLVDAPPPPEKLEQHHAKAVHVALRRQVACAQMDTW
jgi:hypothetical protein